MSHVMLVGGSRAKGLTPRSMEEPERPHRRRTATGRPRGTGVAETRGEREMAEVGTTLVRRARKRGDYDWVASG